MISKTSESKNSLITAEIGMMTRKIDLGNDADLLMQTVRCGVRGFTEIHPRNERSRDEDRERIALRWHPDQVTEHNAHQQQKTKRLKKRPGDTERHLPIARRNAALDQDPHQFAIEDDLA